MGDFLSSLPGDPADLADWRLDGDSSRPGAEVGPKRLNFAIELIFERCK